MPVAVANAPKTYEPVEVTDVKFPSCRIADDMEAGRLRSLTRPDPLDWRRACTQAFYARNGDLHLCADPFHEAAPRCRLCHEPCEGLDELTDDRRCLVEWLACEHRQQQRAENHPRRQMWVEIEARAEAAKAEARRVAAIERGDRPPREPRAKLTNIRKALKPDTILDSRCEHCGEPTRGGRFVAGHDAKLKGLLLTAAKGGDVQALAEMIERSWVKEGTRKSIRQEFSKRIGTGTGAIGLAVTRVDKLFAEAEAVIQATSSRAFLTARVVERING